MDPFDSDATADRAFSSIDHWRPLMEPEVDVIFTGQLYVP